MDILIKNSEVAQLAARILNGIATDSELAGAKLDDIYAIKTDTSAIHVRGVAAPVIKMDDGSRTRRFIASDETQDRMGDIIRVRGWKFDQFKANPVALWGHDSDSFPIGRVHDWTMENESGRPVLRESISYFTEQANPVSEAVLRMIDEGGLRAVSVGFVPTRAYKPKNEAERKELGLGPYGVLYEEQQQLELSNCTIPANPNALLSKGASEPIVAAMDDMVKRGAIGRALADQLLRSVASITPARRSFALGAVVKVDQAELDATYSAWRESVNMSASELKAWDENECSRKASVDADAVIKRNLRLLETAKENWDADLIEDAKRTISFVARMKNMEQGEPVSEACPISKRDISLKNWAYDPMKKSTKSDAPVTAADPLQECVSSKIPKLIEEHPEWKIDQVVAVAYSMCREGTASADKSACGCGTKTKAAPDELKVGDFVTWDSSGGMAVGEIVDIETNGKIEVPNSDFSVEGTSEDPAAMIKIYKEMEGGEYEETDVFVAHKFSTLTKMEVETETEVEVEESMMEEKPEGEEMSKKLTALDKRLSDLMIALESLEKRLDQADIAKAVTVQHEQATALRSSKSVDAAAFYAQVVERVARGL
jgi:hypothetical protein